MRFRFSGYGQAVSAPLVFNFRAGSIEAARQGALRVLGEVAECECAEVSGGGVTMRFSARLAFAGEAA